MPKYIELEAKVLVSSNAQTEHANTEGTTPAVVPHT